LATLPSKDNAAALVFELARSGLVEMWASPAILDEYADVLEIIPISSLRLWKPARSVIH